MRVGIQPQYVDRPAEQKTSVGWKAELGASHPKAGPLPAFREWGRAFRSPIRDASALQQDLASTFRYHRGAVAGAVLAALLPGAVLAEPVELTRIDPLETHATAQTGRIEFSDPSLVSRVRLIGDGEFSSSTGIESYTRSYNQSTAGTLRFRRGSPPPPSSILADEDRDTLARRSPGRALDAMAAAFGVKTGFEAMAHSKTYYDPSQVNWWGLCAPWSWTSLHPEINRLVDAQGPEGQRGRWLAGQWISGADSGNWMMAVANPFLDLAAIAPNAMSLGKPGPVDILQAASMMVEGAPGVIADIHNDDLKGSVATWNQPFVAVPKITWKTVHGPIEDAVRSLAAKDGWKNMAAVKYVSVTARYGAHASVDYEGAPRYGTKTWNMYVVVNDDGDARWGFMASDPRLSGVEGVERASDDPPDYFAKLSMSYLDDALQGRRNPAFEWKPNAKEFLFFVRAVLQKGVPGQVRSAFERELSELPAGVLSEEAVRSLATKYPRVASAYSPEQWSTHFASRGLDARAFGAAWLDPAPI